MMNTNYRIKHISIDTGRRKDIQTRYPCLKFANTVVFIVCARSDEDFGFFAAFGRNVSVFRAMSEDGGRMLLRVRKMRTLIHEDWSISEDMRTTSVTLNEPLVSVAFGGMLGKLLRSQVPPYQQTEWDSLMSCMRRLILEGGYFIPKPMHELASSVWERTTRKTLHGLHTVTSEAAERRRQLVLRLTHWR